MRLSIVPYRIAIVSMMWGALLPTAARAGVLTFDERVEAQRTIEQVYWRRRIWPEQNPNPKPSLSAVMPDGAIRAKVDDYLKKSNALESIWNRPITTGQLQTEMDRMTRHSRDGLLLRELFAALGNDPTMIAETLVRPSLADREIRALYASDRGLHGDIRRKAQAALAACGNPSCLKSLGGEYRETVWTTGSGAAGRSEERLEEQTVQLDAGEWKDHLQRLARQLGGAPESLPLGRLSDLEDTPEAFVVTAVIAERDRQLTTATMAWKKQTFDSWWSARSETLPAHVPAASAPLSLAAIDVTGCSADTWAPTSTGSNDPTARHFHAAVWTGAEMIVWGGRNGSTYFNTGGRYNPATDTWATTSTGANVPDARQRPSGVWTGTELIIWGGYNDASGFLKTGARYNPASNTWISTSAPASLHVRSRHTTVWTGTEMIVWGGDYLDNGFVRVNTGDRYNPSADTWTATSTGANVPGPRVEHTAVWTGTEMIVWGGDTDGPPEFNTGGRYNPSTDTWTATSTGANVPAPRSAHTAVWTGSRMIVWGGYGNGSYLETGGRYNPSTDAWLPTSTGAGVPGARFYTASVWTGADMVVWGGYGNGYSNTGGRYDPNADSWTPTSTGANVPDARYYHSAVWTGSEMIVWSGLTGDGYVNTGGRYCACVAQITAYRDADGDGYGDAALTIATCGGSPPAGYVANNTDCDDAHAAVHPGAPETCNGVDDDCDATVDNGGNALCNDGNPCTDDACNGSSGCGHVNNTAACDDGNACTIGDSCGSGSCTPGVPVPPPAEVEGVLLDGHESTTLTWIGIGGGDVYDIAWSTVSELQAHGTATAACLENDLATPSYVDGQADPAVDDGYYFLIRAQSACGSGSYGVDSTGAKRAPSSACP